ncbi:(d)CMP kinase [Alicyclobacillaceae bacterium I2511]|nr:(d)CMP kinase [Alicyclobacillaceae bacterium I2511]
MQHVVVTIDGPAGAGKSTVAKKLARRMGALYVDSGAMYRAVAWLAVHYRVPENQEELLLNLLSEHPLELHRSHHGIMEISVDGHPVADQLRTPQVSNIVSQVAAHPRVRQQLTRWQREVGKRESVVMDGRDIGTVVFPDAQVKVYLTASLTERARRRVAELSDQGYSLSTEELIGAIESRDEQDASRTVAPLQPAADAYHIDSTGKSVAEVVDEILILVHKVTHE